MRSTSGRRRPEWQASGRGLLILLAGLSLLPACGGSRRAAVPPAGGHVLFQGSGRLPSVAFADGPLRVDRISGTIALPAVVPPPGQHQLTLTVHSLDDHEQELALGFRGMAPTRISVPAHQTQSVNVTAQVRHVATTGLHKVRIDLVPCLGGQPWARRPGRVEVRILLPPGVPGLMRSSLPLERGPAVGNRVTYLLELDNVFVTELQLLFRIGGATLEIEKSITPVLIAGAGPVEVVLSLRNISGEDAVDVRLEDGFDAWAFSASGNGFAYTGGPGNDARLNWSGTVNRIPAGSTRIVTFTVDAKRAVFGTYLSAATAHIAGHLVGVSNRIELSRP